MDKNKNSYLMESDDEGLRLELKTDRESVKRQADWAGIAPGMRVLDVGCGVGVTTTALADLVGEQGHVTGLDFSAERLDQARKQEIADNVTFIQHDIHAPYIESQPYDAIWSRFFLEYFRANQLDIISNSIASLRPGGIACLADLDNNSLGHAGLSAKLQTTFEDIARRLEQDFNFDLYAGRRLYGHLYDLGFKELACTAEMHHFIYGESNPVDRFNWLSKVDVAAKNSGCQFELYGGSFAAFREEFEVFLNDPRRFTYTPVIIARGVKVK